MSNEYVPNLPKLHEPFQLYTVQITIPLTPEQKRQKVINTVRIGSLNKLTADALMGAVKHLSPKLFIESPATLTLASPASASPHTRP